MLKFPYSLDSSVLRIAEAVKYVGPFERVSAAFEASGRIARPSRGCCVVDLIIGRELRERDIGSIRLRCVDTGRYTNNGRRDQHQTWSEICHDRFAKCRRL
jgi:hypothetical protein